MSFTNKKFLTKKKKMPSRIRYEEKHPIVSFRIGKELEGRLQVVKEREGKSAADVLQAGVGLFEVKIAKEEEIEKRIRDRTYVEGFNKAKNTYRVTYPCWVCGKETTVTTQEERDVLSKFMREHGWGHPDCLEKKLIQASLAPEHKQQ